MVWMREQIMEIAPFFSKPYDQKSPGSVKIQNQWLKAFPADQRRIKYFNVLKEKPEEVQTG